MVTYTVQDITGQNVGKDKFLKVPFKLRTPDMTFHPTLFLGDKLPRSSGRILQLPRERTSQDVGL